MSYGLPKSVEIDGQEFSRISLTQPQAVPEETETAGAQENALKDADQLEEKLVEAEEKQQALRNQKQQMLSGISHDLKTPITVIRGYVDAIRDGLVPPEDRDRYLAIIEDRVDTMTNLISSLSDFSMLEHPDFAYTVTEGNLAEYLREYIAGRYQELNIQGYSMEADIPEENIRTAFDHHQLNRVWENIISNSVKYTPKGTTLFVRLMKSADGKNIIIHSINKFSFTF